MMYHFKFIKSTEDRKWLGKSVEEFYINDPYDDVIYAEACRIFNELVIQAQKIRNFQFSDATISLSPTLLNSTPTFGPVIIANDSYASEAWKLLNNPSKVKDRSGLASYLDEVGITHEEDLLLISDERVVSKIMSFLKIIPAKRFLNAVSKLKRRQEEASAG